MWWAVYITIVIGPHRHQTIIPPQTFSNYGECQQLADRLAEMPLPKKVMIKIKCGDALGEG